MKRIKLKYKKMLCVLAALSTFALSAPASAEALQRGSASDEVVIAQQRLFDLGYVQFRATGKYGEMTYEGVAEFQAANGIAIDGQLGENTFERLFSPAAKRAPINGTIQRVVGAGLMATAKKFGRTEEWSVIDEKIPVGTSVTITDFNTLAKFKVKRMGGENHADVAPVSAEDANTLTTCFGGGETWEKRPMLVKIDGVTYAASMFGAKNADGSYCLYFTDSGSDIGGAPDVEHEAMIAVAAGL